MNDDPNQFSSLGGGDKFVDQVAKRRDSMNRKLKGDAALNAESLSLSKQSSG